MSAPSKRGASIVLPPLADLFSTQQERDEADLEKIEKISLSEIVPFPEHPFQVRDDDEMQKLVDSIKEYGVLMPVIVRPRSEGGYEMVSGHRRMHACELAGIQELPVLVREMDDDTAILLMVDSNVQRENILPSEKAKAYKMKRDAIDRVKGRPKKVGQVVPDYFGKRTTEIIAEGTDESYKQVQRYINLNNLIPELLTMVDSGKLKLTPAVELSHVEPEEQYAVYEYLDSQSCSPSLSQAQKLRAASKEKCLSEGKMEEIMTSQKSSVKPRPQQIVIPMDKISHFFPQSFTSEQIAVQIIHLVENQYRMRHRSEMER